MPRDSRIAGRLLSRVRARNRDLLLELAIELALGVLFTVLTSGVVFCIAWFVYFSIAGIGFPITLAALGTTALFVLVATVSAWRRVDPFAGLQPLSDGEHVALAVSHVVNGYVHINRHSVAGMAALLLGGPANLVGALRTWLHRLPTDPELIEHAAELLASCRTEIDLNPVRSDVDAAVLLRRLNLILPRAGSNKITLTEKGRALAGRNGGAAALD